MTETALRALESLIQPATLALLGGPRVLLEVRGPGRRPYKGGLRYTFRFKFVAVENLGKFLSQSPLQLMRVIESNERTAQRRKEQGALTADESDRIARVARIVRRAIEAFGNSAQAREWLKRPNRTLQGSTPLELLVTDAGAALVTDELGRIEYGELY